MWFLVQGDGVVASGLFSDAFGAVTGSRMENIGALTITNTILGVPHHVV